MAYVSLLIIPIIIAVALFMTPAARQSSWQAIESRASATADYVRSAVSDLEKGPGPTERFVSLQKRLTAYILRQVADKIDEKQP